MGPRGRPVEALRCPGHPVGFVGEQVKGEQLAAIVHAVPANGAGRALPGAPRVLGAVRRYR